MPMFVAPVAGALSDRIGGRPLHGGRAGAAGGRARRGWPRSSTPTVAVHRTSSAPFIIAGVGMGLFFAPVANVVLSAVRPAGGRARPRARTTRSASSAASSASRCSPSIFANQGGYCTAETFIDGLKPAVWVGAAVVGVGALAATLLPGRGRRTTSGSASPALQGAD